METGSSGYQRLLLEAPVRRDQAMRPNRESDSLPSSKGLAVRDPVLVRDLVRDLTPCQLGRAGPHPGHRLEQRSSRWVGCLGIRAGMARAGPGRAGTSGEEPDGRRRRTVAGVAWRRPGRSQGWPGRGVEMSAPQAGPLWIRPRAPHQVAHVSPQRQCRWHYE